jgi:hypothetical protein
MAAPLTNFLKKFIRIYEWDGACDEAFETLKDILVKAPMLKLPDFDKDFEIPSDASDFAIGRVLVQEGRPVAFESKKLSETERRWPTHEKEMWVAIHCLKTWGHYIGSKDLVVWTDNVTLKYFVTQPKLSSKQVRWQNTFTLFNVDIRHKPRKENITNLGSRLLCVTWDDKLKLLKNLKNKKIVCHALCITPYTKNVVKHYLSF